LKVLFISPFFEPAWSYGGIARTASEWAHACASSSSSSFDIYTTTANGNKELDV